jgi:hypothetical protein
VVNKPEAQEEWAYQGEYRVWSKRCASFNLPLCVERLTKSGRRLPEMAAKWQSSVVFNAIEFEFG